MQVTIVIAFVFAATATAIDKDKDNNTRIINGKEAEPHSIPFQAGLLLTLPNVDDVKHCGGSIISNQWILTAGHCINVSISIEVVLGAHKFKENEATQIRVNSTEFVLHEDFDYKTKVNDIGLIKLPNPIEFNDYIQPISLDSKTNLDGLEVTVSGWGLIFDMIGANMSKVLRTVTVSVMPNLECVKYSKWVLDTMICIDSGMTLTADSLYINEGLGKGFCPGDSGGPLVLNGTTQVGIVSFAIRSCNLGFPGVFTRVSSYIEWIKEKIPNF